MALEIKKVTDPAFKKYGRVINGYNLSDILDAMESAPCPKDVIYVPAVASLESLMLKKRLEDEVYGGLPVQIGYCNGNNYDLNALEYHRSSEINIAATDLILMLGAQQDIEDDFTYDTAKVECFLISKGTMIEVYATTLHYAPCNADDGGFKCVVALPKGTNYDIENQPEVYGGDAKLLFASNKWLIAHADSGLDKDGAFIGLKGDNLSLR
ncbi:MAG: DUF4867 family protein [Ruminococcus sp.]|nr:DUF4867 family protein [Ruminococcus sp.]